MVDYVWSELQLLLLDVPTAKRTIRKQLLPLCDLTWRTSTTRNLLQDVINAVMLEIDNFRAGQPLAGADWELFLRGDLQQQIGCRIFEFASLQVHLRHLVPERYWETPQLSSSEWLQYLAQRGITVSNELDWSGCGQHVEYKFGATTKYRLKQGEFWDTEPLELWSASNVEGLCSQGRRSGSENL